MLLEMKAITKKFFGVCALDKVDFELKEKEVHILVGENGAGKSTLMKVLAGVYDNYEGEIFIDGKKVSIKSAKDAEKNGVSIIFQEFNLIPDLTVAENIFLGRERTTGALKNISWKDTYSEAQKILDELQVDIPANALVKDLGVAQMQMVEVAKAISLHSKIIIMDEPTAALSDNEIKNLFRIIKRMKSEGVSIIYISHRLEEYEEIGDRATIMRDGRYIKTLNVADATREEMIRLMVGRELKDIYPKIKVQFGREAFRVENFSRSGVFSNISFSLKKGEILGISGLMGAGRTEIVRAIFGLDKHDSGKVFLDGKEIKIKNPSDAIQAGIGFITEDRKNEGLVLPLSVGINITLASLDNFVQGWHMNLRKEKQERLKYIENLHIKTVGENQPVLNLSGGNQQKVVIAKWLMTKSKVLIFDEPTRGIDVGAKFEIYKLINELIKEGVAVILISSELPELIGMSDRIITLRGGIITAEFDRNEFNQVDILNCATGGRKNGTVS